jgi:hypothetical protein
MAGCNVDEIMKELKVLDTMKQLKENMGEADFTARWPELAGIGGKLETEIAKQEEVLTTKMSECGRLDSDVLPEETNSQPLDEITEPEPDIEPEPDLLPDEEVDLDSE